jgi:hypothetical protein
MFLGELIVAGKRGLIGETISMVSICLPFPQGRVNSRRFLKNLRTFCTFPQGRVNSRRYPSGHLQVVTKEHEKMSIRTSSSCDKRAREDVYQDIFKL